MFCFFWETFLLDTSALLSVCFEEESSSVDLGLRLGLDFCTDSAPILVDEVPVLRLLLPAMVEVLLIVIFFVLLDVDGVFFDFAPRCFSGVSESDGGLSLYDELDDFGDFFEEAGVCGASGDFRLNFLLETVLVEAAGVGGV